MEIYIDGKFYPKDEAKISVFDHGLLYGDGVFEGIRIYHQKVFRLKDHLDRLYRSAKYINLDPGVSVEEMEGIVLESCRRNGLSDGYIRLIVTRGVGTLGLDPKKCPKASIICIVDSLAIYPKEYYERGLVLLTVSTRRNIGSALDPQTKTMNYLNNILAKLEADRSGFEEALMLNAEGYVAEAAADNLFIITKKKLLTPATYLGALPGITRAAVLEIAPEFDLETHETHITLPDVYSAEECFLTGTAAEVIPVVEVDGRKIGDGKPGPLTQRLIERFHRLTREEGVSF
ncbi:MAG: branched-chain-amino-acid transaminase [Candidatus Omnitrophica bacterium]|nr:branched-chain-amino-acid transaminase [Candidatus Omnitrophota bacterium]MCA9415132.1 branched-chain-amino-acid transaminase [Candidatus Omnitrophota bacterium]MCA9424071.1 branched-chain-amino-acid transaminase [Candidatus Omnitrophota bacterium]MCA9429100.1 branched-chain-amino-acid transaminase [Candidatus Omnitrophota bacterium]MCA9435006.1 branched-chain-amino-acid transaminase [Candidatus Omnitrophota bacterium]